MSLCTSEAPAITAPGRWTELASSVGGLRFRHAAREGVGPSLLCIHGVGPGTTGQANFNPLLAVLPESVPVHLIDLIGFGASARKPAQPGFDVALWLDQIEAALDRIGGPAILVGNSVGGALALKTAARRDDLQGVLALGAAAAGGGATAELKAFWRAPRDRDALAAAMAPMTGARSAPSPQLVAERWAAFSDPDYARWFDETLADPGACLSAAALTADEAAKIRTPSRILHGMLDRACPPGPLAELVIQRLPRADLTLLGGCGHNVIAERTADVVAAITQLTTRKSTI